jgi:hypothetical protein
LAVGAVSAAASGLIHSGDSCGTAEIMRQSGKAKPKVWRWQARFMAEGVAGLTRDKTRKPGKPPLPVASVQRVVDLAAGVSWRSVRRILEAHQLVDHPGGHATINSYQLPYGTAEVGTEFKTVSLAKGCKRPFSPTAWMA